MKIEFQVNKNLPDIQYIASIEELPMATFSPILTEVKVKKERLDRKGITITEDKFVQISKLKFLLDIILGKNLRDIVQEKSKLEYTFNHKIING